MCKKIVLLLLAFVLSIAYAPLSFAEEMFYDDFSTAPIGGVPNKAKWAVSNYGLAAGMAQDPKDGRKAFKIGSEKAASGEYTFYQSNPVWSQFTGPTVTFEQQLFFPSVLGDNDYVALQFFTNECTVTSGSNRNDTNFAFGWFQGKNLTINKQILLTDRYPVGEWFTLRYILYCSGGKYDVQLIQGDSVKTLLEGVSMSEGWAMHAKTWGLKKIRNSFYYNGGDTKEVYFGASSVMNGIPSDAYGANPRLLTFPTGTTGSEFEPEIQLISALGILTEETVNPEASVSRSKAIRYAMNAAGIEAGLSANSGFSDVGTDHKDACYITTAVQAGIIDRGEVFLPDDAATGMQYIKMLFNLIGYQPVADVKGGYPYGYLRLAEDYKVLNGVSKSLNEVLTFGQMARLTKNFLNIYLPEESFDNENLVVQVAKNQTVAYGVFGMNKARGIVNATKQTALDGIPHGEDRVSIDRYELVTLYEGIHELYGQYVEYWYNDDGELYYAYPYGDYNSLTTVVSSDKEFAENGGIRYLLENEKELTLSVSSDAIYLYNGIRLQNPSDNDVLMADKILAISNDGDNKADVLNLIHTTVFTVGGVSANEMFVFDKNGNTAMHLADKKMVTIYKNGQPARISHINRGDIVAIATERIPYGISPDTAEYITVYASDTVISGEVTMFMDESVWIDDTKYLIAPNQPALSLGDRGTFGLDYLGRIAGLTKASATVGAYGLLLDINQTKVNFEETISFLILTAENEEKTFYAKEFVDIDGVKTKVSDVKTKLQPYLKKELILYDLSLYGDIYSIDTPRNCSVEVPYRAFCPEEFSKDYEGTSVYTNQSGGTLSPSHLWTSSTIVFCQSVSNENEFYVVSADEIVDGTHEVLKVYNSNQNRQAEAAFFKTSLIGKGLFTSEFMQTPPMILTRVSKAVDKDGEISLKLTGLRSGQEVSVWCDASETKMITGSQWDNHRTYSIAPRTSVNQLKRGDIIQYHMGRNGRIDSIHILYNSDIPISEVSHQVLHAANYDNRPYYSILAMNTGEVQLTQENFVTISTAAQRSFYLTDSTSVTLYDKSGDSIRSVGIYDISLGDTVMICSRRSTVRSVYIFKN